MNKMIKLLERHVAKSFARLCDSEYQLPDVFKPASYTWQGDWEGRALLAFCNLYKITGKKNPDMDEFINIYPSKTNQEGFLGKLLDINEVDEQQLSGHNWLLSGMVEYCKLFGSDIALKVANDIFSNLYEKATDAIMKYPLERKKLDVGGVSGTHTGLVLSNWKVSSDVGCVFMCIDGVSRYYELTKDGNALKFLETAIGIFKKFDKREARAQTHTTLTATRGIFRLYKTTGDKKYLELAKEVYELYVNHGMTYTYENFNWFERKDTWTEPCAVVDSFILSVQLYRETNEAKYLTLLRRIWFNGLNHCQRIHGGVGTSKTVYSENAYTAMNLFEAPFCCTMRYCEGLQYADENKELLEIDENAEIIRDEIGRRFIDDALIVTDEETGKEIPLYTLAFQDKNEKKYKVF